MKIIDDIEKSINESIELEKKSPPSTRKFNISGLVLGAFAGFLLAVSVLMFIFADERAAILCWQWIFYPALILIIISLAFVIAQRIRGSYFLSCMAIIIDCLCLAAMIILIVVMAIIQKEVFIFPFNYIS